MTTRPLLAGALLLAGSAFALAQSTPPANTSEGAAPPPPAIQNALPDKIAPADELKKRAEPKAGTPGPETTGAAVPATDTFDVPPRPGVTAHPIDQLDKKPDLQGPERK
jgi:hypothetical protein